MAGGATTAFALSFSRRALGDIGHGIEIRHTGTMHPAQHLLGAEGLFALLGKPGSQAFGIEIEQIARIIRAPAGIQKTQRPA
jgi:hypothetical protein